MGRRREYVPRDGRLHQSYRTWDPIPVKGPNGEAPGCVVLVEHKGPLASTAEERE